MIYRTLLATSLILNTIPALAETVVTTYVVKTQEERASTRWTLTEWLRIKERMKMMDVWLAMFSDPKKDRFRPELNLSYGLLQGSMSLVSNTGASEKGTLKSQSLKGQLWLTNILTGTVGIRSLNIDLGFEAGSKGSLTPFTQDETEDSQLSAAPTFSDDFSRQHNTQYGSANLRIFGKNIQDTSLVLKYGKYSLRDTTLGHLENSLAAFSKDDVQVQQDGVMAGAELQLYLLTFLGAEGSYHAYGTETSLQNKDKTYGQYYEYLGFIEVSFIRFMVGHYQENWTMVRPVDQTKFDTTESGLFTGVKLQF